MLSESLIYWAPQFLAGIISIIVAFCLWRRRSSHGAKTLMVLIIATAEWAFTGALHDVSPDLSTKILLSKIQYIGIVTVPPALLSFTLQYTGREKWLTARNLFLLAIIPAVTLILAWTNDFHWLLWRKISLDSSGPVPTGVYYYGDWFWFNITFVYLVIFLSTILLVRAFTSSPYLYKMQVLILLIGVSAPWLANGLYIFGLNPFPNIDITPMAFAITGLALFWGLFLFRIADILPVARETVLENIPDGVIVLDYHNRIVDLNQAAQKIISRSGSGVIGQSIFQVFAGQTGLIEQLNDSTETNLEITLGENLGWRCYNLRTSPLKDRQDRLIGKIIILHDLTGHKHAEEEKEKLEARLQRAQKMEAIGTLAGGVAHDLNNVLSGIVSYPDLLLMDLPKESPLRKPILTIQQSGEKAAAIVQDLLTLARRGIAVTEITNINQIVNDYLDSPEHEKLIEFHTDVKIESHIETDLMNIMGSPVHLSKTIMNLVSNAAEAMPDGGNILISTQSKYIDTPVRGYDDVKEGDYVILTVSDTGTGMSSADLERIFEPFYTKKVMGRSGSGLGMSVVWGTVKDHKGYIDVQSIEGKGTVFTLYFPATRKEISGKEKALPIEKYKGSGESILVVDDVEGQREIASQMLNKLDYSVTSVLSGEEAVEYMKNNSVDLLVLDMIMDPGIDGLDTYKRILKLRPHQKAIIASGFSETERVKEVQRLGAGKYIKKPYTLEKIGLAVKEELKK
ncbi:MAG: histidine kinase N-terminal 7TM domain-containing protein [Thermodesulfobacteriota bacterium]|nr:histidine kinase N-terminal 7TM domain-containing protein [Thermodesulfobacteriota bacterium]